MRIGIDARFYGPKAKGLGRYTQELIEQLALLDDKNEYFIFLGSDDFLAAQIEAKNFTKVLADFQPYSLREQLIFPLKIWRTKLDLMHFTHFNVPFFYRGKFVATIHDLILKKFPTKRPGIFKGLRYFFKNIFYDICLRSAVRRACQILTVSHFTKNDLIDYFGLEPAKISVIYEGVSRLTLPPASKEAGQRILEKYGIRPPFLLYVGNAYPHKNLPFLLEAFELLLKKSGPKIPQLVLAGKKDDFFQKIEKNFHRLCRVAPANKKTFCTQVIFTGFLPDHELAFLYRQAFLYVFPSLYEGFGLPGLEAMFFDLPVLSSNAASLPEIFGEAAYYFDPSDKNDFVAKAKHIFQDQFLRQKLISLGRQRVKKFNWQETARQTLTIYKKIN